MRLIIPYSKGGTMYQEVLSSWQDFSKQELNTLSKRRRHISDSSFSRGWVERYVVFNPRETGKKYYVFCLRASEALESAQDNDWEYFSVLYFRINSLEGISVLDLFEGYLYDINLQDSAFLPNGHIDPKVLIPTRKEIEALGFLGCTEETYLKLQD